MIGDRGDDFAQRNGFLHLALGIVSASNALDRVLDRYGHRLLSAEAPPRSREDEQLVEFVLGLIALRDKAIDTLSAARRVQRPSCTSTEEPLREVLR